MAPPLRVTLDQAARDELDRRYQTTRDATTRSRYQMVWLAAEGHPALEIARLVRRSPDTVRRVLKRYLAGGPAPCRTAPTGPAAPLPARLGGRAAAGHRAGPAPGRGRQRQLDDRLLAAYLAARPGTAPRRDGEARLHRADYVCKRPLDAPAQAQAQPGWEKRAEGGGAARAAASPVPPPACDLVPDATWPRAVARGPARSAGAPARADLYLQDEVEVALHPTLTRVWSRTGRRGQRLVEAPGKNPSGTASGWSTGATAGLGAGRRPPAAPLCAQVRRRWRARRPRGRIAIVILDNLGTHTPAGSKLVRALLAELGEHLVLVYTPTYDPDANRIEWLWRACAARSPTTTSARTSRRCSPTPTGGRARSPQPRCCRRSAAPSRPDQQPTISEELDHAA